MRLTGKNRITVHKDGEAIEVFNHVSVSTHHYINSVNSYETFEPEITKGDLGDGPQPEAVTERVAMLLDTEFHIDVRKLGIDVIDPEGEEVEVV